MAMPLTLKDSMHPTGEEEFESEVLNHKECKLGRYLFCIKNVESKSGMCTQDHSCTPKNIYSAVLKTIKGGCRALKEWIYICDLLFRI